MQSIVARYSFYWPGTASNGIATCFWGTGTEATTGTVSQVCTKTQVQEGGAGRETGTGGRIRYRREKPVQEGESGTGGGAGRETGTGGRNPYRREKLVQEGESGTGGRNMYRRGEQEEKQVQEGET